jgi:hypothetical protein
VPKDDLQFWLRCGAGEGSIRRTRLGGQSSRGQYPARHADVTNDLQWAKLYGPALGAMTTPFG